MWIALICGWVIASAILYIYLVKTAKEPQNEQCVDCRLTDCSACPKMVSSETETLKRAA